jgi:hypothetical protein
MVEKMILYQNRECLARVWLSCQNFQECQTIIT